MKQIFIKRSAGKNFQSLKDRIKKCEKCDISQACRSRPFYRGKFPCELLFVGEAPGIADDEFGFPFTGESGELLDKIIDQVLLEKHWRIGFTNVIQCYPNDGNGNFRPPKKSEIKNCSKHLSSVVERAKAQHIVRVGKIAQKINFEGKVTVDIYHPSYMLRTGSEDSPAYLDAVAEVSSIPPF